MENIRALKGTYIGKDIYILASGKSMDFFDPHEFDGRITVGVNQVHRKFPCTYVVSHHSQDCQEVIDAGLLLVVAEYECGQYKWGHNAFNGHYYTYKHADNQQTRGIDLAALDTDDSLAISASTVADAIHFAYHLGAGTIWLVGADHGRIDKEMNFEGYNSNESTNPAHLPLTEPLIIRLVNEIRKRGTPVHSCNPWINFGLEGHRYSRPPAGSVYLPAEGFAEMVMEGKEPRVAI